MKTKLTTLARSSALTGLLFLAILTTACQQSTNSTAADAAPEKVNVEALMAPFAPKVQTFTVSGKKPSTVTGQAGTKIHVQPKNLTLADGSPVQGDIEVKLIECTRKSEILGAGLQTLSDGQLLQSGGSYYIDMQSQGQALTIQDGKSVDVEFPKVADEKMELFYGVRNADGQMNWEQTGTPFKEPKPAKQPAISVPSSTVEVDTMYGYISGTDTIRSANIEDIWAYIDQEQNAKAPQKPKTMSNEEKRLQRKAEAEQQGLSKTEIQNRKNQQALQDRREMAAANAAAKQKAKNQANQSNEYQRNLRANAEANDAVATNSYGTLKLNRFGWINCDRYLGETNLAPVAVRFESSQKPALVYFVMKGENVILSNQYPGFGGQVLSAPLPIGREIVVIAMTSDDSGSKYTFAQSEYAVGSKEPVNLTLKPTEKATIQAVLDAI